MPAEIHIDKNALFAEIKLGITQPKIAEKFGVKLSLIERKIRKYGFTNVKKEHYDKMIVEDPIFCYLLGWFCTDGYLTSTNRVSLRIYDEDVITSLSQYFNTSKYTIKPRGKIKECHELAFSKAPHIFKNTYTTSKTNDVILPDIPLENFNMFLRGVIEGDGSIRPYKSRYKSSLIRIFSNSEEFARQLQSKVTFLGFPIKLRKDRMGWELSSGSTELLTYAYTNHTDYVCNRKYTRVKQWLSI